MCQQLSGGQQQAKPVYKGIYSDWSVEEEDVREVIAYRAGLNVAALGEKKATLRLAA